MTGASFIMLPANPNLNMKNLLYFVILTLVINTSCAQKNGYTTFSSHYPEQPKIIKMEKELEEISGISYNPLDSTVYAISDDKGSLYKVSISDGRIISKSKFYEAKNFEDLVIVGDSCYALNSNGNIVSFNYKSGNATNAVMHKITEGGKNEFEILYFDRASNNLILICKGCERDKKSAVSTFAYNLSTGTYSNGAFTLDARDILKKAIVEKNRFKPSAAAIHPITGELYIISSVNKLLVVTSPDGKLKQSYSLDIKLFKQPEGILFTPAGDMLISNEAAKKGSANILYYKYSQ
jgi:uncharacterized protein YjiK